jgi:hypothetical protein
VCSRELPVVDAVASEYLEAITFLAVAQNSTPEASAQKAGVWFDPNRIMWGYSDEIGPMYGALGQPVSVLISEGRVVDMWFGNLPEPEIRAKLDALIGA